MLNLKRLWNHQDNVTKKKELQDNCNPMKSYDFLLKVSNISYD